MSIQQDSIAKNWFKALQLAILNRCWQFLKKHPKKVKESISELPVLTPSKYATNIEFYEKRLNHLLINEPDVHEIAITAPYAGGKSSFIETYKNNNPHLKSISISLADFNNVKKADESELPENTSIRNSTKTVVQISCSQEENTNSPESDASKKLNKIEKSILQQLLYSVRDKILPNSRFRKITMQRKKSKDLFAFGLGLTIFSFSLAIIFFPNVIKKLVLFDYFLTGINTSLFAVAGLFIIGIGTLIVKDIISSLQSYSISKVNLLKGEVGFEAKNNDSIFNKYLEEIIYFFHSTKRELVIFEDIDRLDNNSALFVKLKELNSLINNSDDINQRVVFIYCIKDDVFTGSDRTKFFDSIIPIVPVTNSANVFPNLKRLIKNSCVNEDLNENELSNSYLRDISPFILDMRLLKNIVTEYGIYRDTLLAKNADLAKERLFSFIVYKNIYANDFALLHHGEGLFAEVLTNKASYIEQYKESIQSNINELKQRIEHGEKEHLQSIDELNAAFINHLLKDIPHIPSTINAISLKDITSKEAFDRLYSSVGRIKYTIAANNQQQNPAINMEEIKTKFSPSYEQRSCNIFDGTEEIKSKLTINIKELEQELSNASGFSLRDLLLTSKVTLKSLNEEKNSLLKHLITKGYIDETYSDYISIFHAGRITAAEMKFISSIKKRVTADNNNISITNFNELIAYLHSDDFSSTLLWNTSLIEHLVGSQSYGKSNAILNGISHSMSSNIDESISWLHSHMTSFESNIRENLLTRILQKTSSIYDVIAQSSSLTLPDKLELIIEFKSYDEELIESKKLCLLLNQSENIVKALPVDRESYNKSIELLVELSVSFEKIDITETEHPFIFDITKHGLFDINLRNLAILSLLQDATDSKIDNTKEIDYPINIPDTFSIDNLIHIFSYSREGVIKRITETIELLNTNSTFTIDTPETALHLLNTKLSMEGVKRALIEQNEFTLNNIAVVEDQNLWSFLIINNRLKISWQNIAQYSEAITYDKTNNSSPSLLNDSNIFAQYINQKSIISILLEEGVDSLDVDQKDHFTEFLFYEDVSLDCFSQYICLFEEGLNNWSIADISFNKVSYLIEHNIISSNTEIYQEVGQYHPDLINLFIEMNFDNYMSWDIQSDEVFSDKDIAYFIRSLKLTNAQKVSVLNKENAELLEFSKETIDEIVNSIPWSEENTLHLHFITKLFNSKISASDKVKLIINQGNHIKRADLYSLLASIKYPYTALVTSASTSLPNTELNRALCFKLKQLGIVSSYKDLGNDTFRVYMKKRK